MLPLKSSFKLFGQLRHTQKIKFMQLNKGDHQIGLPLADHCQIFGKLSGAMNAVVMLLDPSGATAHTHYTAAISHRNRIDLQRRAGELH